MAASKEKKRKNYEQLVRQTDLKKTEQKRIKWKKSSQEISYFRFL